MEISRFLRNIYKISVDVTLSLSFRGWCSETLSLVVKIYSHSTEDFTACIKSKQFLHPNKKSLFEDYRLCSK